MEVATVTTTDSTLLRAVRGAIENAEEALLCVAFVQERGLHLLKQELSGLKQRRAPARLLVTTAFNPTPEPALSLAADLGLDVRVLNPGSGRSYHPKLYLGRHALEARAVVGSANLTGGLATNIEVAVSLKGGQRDGPVASAWAWAESLWNHAQARAWAPTPGRSDLGREVIAPELLEAIVAARQRDPIFVTIGPRPVPNVISDLSGAAVYVETERSRRRGTGPQEVPAWMLNIAWDYLRSHGRLTNRTLLHELRVHRSSAVCAILARVPGVRVRPRRDIELEWVGESHGQG